MLVLGVLVAGSSVVVVMNLVDVELLIEGHLHLRLIVDFVLC